MTNAGQQPARHWIWIAALAILLATVAYQQHVRAKQRNLCDRIVAIRERILKHKTQRSDDARMRTVAQRHSHNSHPGLATLLKDCTSRENFLIDSGSLIAWSELRDTVGGKRLALYVPEGQHRLKYAVLGGGKGPQTITSQYRRRETYGIESATNCELTGEEVYEIALLPDEQGGPLRLVVRGEDNASIHERDLAILKGPCRFPSVVAHGPLALPSEVHLDDFQSSRSDDFKSSRAKSPQWWSHPVIHLASVYVNAKDSHVLVRLWLESDAPPCMRATVVAGRYPEIMELRKKVVGANTKQTLRELFLPFDGSDRFVFREGIFDERKTTSD